MWALFVYTADISSFTNLVPDLASFMHTADDTVLLSELVPILWIYGELLLAPDHTLSLARRMHVQRTSMHAEFCNISIRSSAERREVHLATRPPPGNRVKKTIYDSGTSRADKSSHMFGVWKRESCKDMSSQVCPELDT